MDRASEDSITAREICLSDSSGAPIHICHVPTQMCIRDRQLTADSIAKLNPTEEDLTALGFDSPYCTISFERDGTEYVWTVGNDTTASDGSAAHYLMTEGKDLIYVVTDANLPWISINIDNM